MGLIFALTFGGTSYAGPPPGEVPKIEFLKNVFPEVSFVDHFVTVVLPAITTLNQVSLDLLQHRTEVATPYTIEQKEPFIFIQPVSKYYDISAPYLDDSGGISKTDSRTNKKSKVITSANWKHYLYWRLSL